MGEQQVRSEHAEVVEVHDRAAARCGRGSARGRTTWARGASSCDVPSSRARSAAPASSSSEARSWPTSVTHPSTSPPAGKRSTTARWRSSTSSHGAVNGPISMSQPHVPIVPRTPAASTPGRHPVGMGDGAGLDHRRHAVAQRLDGTQRGRQLVVVAGVGAVQRHRPLEDRRARREQVGDATAHERIAGQVLVGVDHAGRDDTAASVVHDRIRMFGEQRGTAADGDDRRPRRTPPLRRRAPRGSGFIVTTSPWARICFTSTLLDRCR